MLRDELIRTATEANIKRPRHDKDRLELIFKDWNEKRLRLIYPKLVEGYTALVRESAALGLFNTDNKHSRATEVMPGPGFSRDGYGLPKDPVLIKLEKFFMENGLRYDYMWFDIYIPNKKQACGYYNVSWELK